MTNTPILHQWAGSPVSEKARLLFGFKRIAWLAVETPDAMPKPDLTVLTGGYRKAPVLQIGADIYCDSALIAKVLERLQPEPTLYPTSAPLAEQFAQWADSILFMACVAWSAQPAGAAVLFAHMSLDQRKAFAADRAAFVAGHARQRPAEARGQLLRHLVALEAQLADGRQFLFGGAASIADFSAAHPLWFVRRAAPVAGILAPYAALNAWLDRMLGYGHGDFQRIDGVEAIAIARAATTHASCAVQPDQGLEAGAAVTVAATDTGREPSAGKLVGLNDAEVVLSRHDERAGTLHVHFPRYGFQIKQEST